MKCVEILTQAGFDARDGFLTRRSTEQPPREAVEFLRDRVVATGDLDELRELAFQRGVLLAQHFDLTLDERDRGSTPDMRQAQARQQRLVALEEVRIVLQISR